MSQTFKGGVHPDDHKSLTHQKPIEQLPLPQQVILPMSMHIGAPCQPVVAVAGSGAGADTAIVLRPEASSRILKTKVDRFICKPID